MSDLADFVLDFCRALGAVVEPPAYGVYDVLLPDAVAAQVGVDAFQRWTFDGQGDGDDVNTLSYGHPVVERLAELARAVPACARFYINDVRLDKTGLLELARVELTFPNATLAQDPLATETRALFHTVRFNFKAALMSDEKRERLVSVLLDAQTAATLPDFSADEALRLEAAPIFTTLPNAPAQWRDAPDPLAPDALRALLDRATHAAAGALDDQLAALRQRTARLLELDRARLEAYYAELERDFERRLKRAEDETRRATLENKLAATRADHAAKLADAEAKYRLRLELELINLAVITQPKVRLSARIENRQATVTRSLVWDPFRHRLEPVACDVCRRPATKLFLCVNQHLACERCLAPQCVECRRVYCRSCAHELTACVVCGRPVCQKSLTRCRECGQGTCREHANQCHAPREVAPALPVVAESPPVQAPTPAKAMPAKLPGSKKAGRGSPQRAAGLTSPATAYRLQVEVRPDKTLVIGFMLTQGGDEAAQRAWQMTADGIRVGCICEMGQRCPSFARVVRPEAPARIEAQMEAELDRFRLEYRIPPFRTAIYVEEFGELIRLPRLRLRGRWKDPELVNMARAVRRSRRPVTKG